ncbi:MAG: hypothetical protein WBA67_15370 [Jannaschia sp.]
MIRPEVAAILLRWRELIAGTVIAMLGAWMVVASGGLVLVAGAALLALGGFLAFNGQRHARFRTEAEAPGVVEVVEGRITYLGPVMGGTATLDDITAVIFRRSSGGEGFWRLTQDGAQPLYIPEGALGSDALLDALVPLPGFDGGAMVRAVQSRTPQTITVWQRPARTALT